MLCSVEQAESWPLLPKDRIQVAEYQEHRQPVMAAVFVTSPSGENALVYAVPDSGGKSVLKQLVIGNGGKTVDAVPIMVSAASVCSTAPSRNWLP